MQHKIASNDKAVLEQFDTNDLASNLKNLDIGSDELPMQRSLGLSWDTSADTIKFQYHQNLSLTHVEVCCQ